MIQRVAWSAAFADAIGAALDHDAPAIARDVKSGAAQAWVTDGPAAIVTRIEQTPDYRECVVVAMAGAGLHRVAPVIVDAARRAGCDRVRFHSNNPAIARLVGRRYDVREVQSVYEVSI